MPTVGKDIDCWCILVFILVVYQFLLSLTCASTRTRAQQLRKFQAAAAFPITCGVFGNFADEVLEVVKIANHRRRMEGVHFISVHHILFGLLKSRVGDTIESILPDAAMNCFAGNPSKFPLYNVYMKSGDAARARGNYPVL